MMKPLMRAVVLSSLLGAAQSFVARQPLPLSSRVVSQRAHDAVASAKIIPAAYVALGGTLLSRAAGTPPVGSRVVLASTGLLCALNLATVDNSRYAGAKRAMALVSGIPPSQMGLAKRWYDIVRLHLAGQLVSLVWMSRASSAAGSSPSPTLYWWTDQK